MRVKNLRRGTIGTFKKQQEGLSGGRVCKGESSRKRGQQGSRRQILLVFTLSVTRSLNRVISVSKGGLGPPVWRSNTGGKDRRSREITSAATVDTLVRGDCSSDKDGRGRRNNK